MLDNQIIDAVATKIEAALAAAGWPYIVSQKTQPTQEGISNTPTVYIQKLFDQHYGPQSSTSTYNQTNKNFDSKENQIVITTFQITSLVTQNPEDLSIPTASDVVNFVKMYLQHRRTIAEFKLIGLNLIQSKRIMNNDFIDDKARFQLHPSFDVEIQHERSIIRTVPSVTSAQGDLYRVPDPQP